MSRNIDGKTVASFGDEWSRYDQSALNDVEATAIFEEYFDIFPWRTLPPDAEGFDMGCGSGRWARYVAPRVGQLHCIEPSSALSVARRMLAGHSNVSFHEASVDDVTLAAGSQDFGYALGVLHHVPDTAAAIRACVDLLRPGAPFLVYLYYAFDNRPIPFRMAWRCSDALRRAICRMHPVPKRLVTDFLALGLYYPLARFSEALERAGVDVANVPLSYYRNHSWYTMRTDSRDRFGTPLEQRFSRRDISTMLEAAGLVNIRFSDRAPYWCAVGFQA